MNSKIKIFSVGLILIFGVVLLAGAGCAQKASTITGKLTGKITNESKCVELMAYSLAAFQYAQSQNFAAIAAIQPKVESLQKQYGWSNDEEVQNSCKEMVSQKGFMDRVGVRVQEIVAETK